MIAVENELGRVLGLQLRRPVTFKVTQAGLPERWRTLCADGAGWLRSDLGARLEVSLDGQALTCGERSGPADPFLDGLALALGSTPFGGELRTWERTTSRPGWLPFYTPQIRSTYHREFQQGRWLQTAAHRGPWNTLMTRAELCAERGLVSLELHCDGKRRLCAHFVEKLWRSSPLSLHDYHLC